MLQMGSFKNKIDLGEGIQTHAKMLIAFSLVLKIGEAKYPSFSWYNQFKNPSADATVKCHLTALLRHFTAHRMGYTLDPDSKLPHLFHMCCRACMLVSAYYLEHNFENKLTKQMTKTRDRLTQCPIGRDVTGEIILSLSKTKDSIISSSAAELESLISDLLLEAVSMRYVIPPVNDPFTEVTLPDLILAACSRYTKAILRESSLRKEYREFVKENKEFYPDNPGIHQDLKCIFEW